ncbi:MAG: hypothetical protein V4592_14945 [Bacteroidota bacterium]
MHNKNMIYPWRVREGAYRFMGQRLKYPIQVDQRMDGQICRITITDYTIKDNIQPQYHDELEKDHLYQIEVLGITDREFLVLHSQLSDLKEDLVVFDENGNKIFG